MLTPDPRSVFAALAGAAVIAGAVGLVILDAAVNTPLGGRVLIGPLAILPRQSYDLGIGIVSAALAVCGVAAILSAVGRDW